jgi:hypothetical protein
MFDRLVIRRGHLVALRPDNTPIASMNLRRPRPHHYEPTSDVLSHDELRAAVLTMISDGTLRAVIHNGELCAAPEEQA